MSIVINSHLITSAGGKHGGLPTFMIDSIFLWISKNYNNFMKPGAYVIIGVRHLLIFLIS